MTSPRYKLVPLTDGSTAAVFKLKCGCDTPVGVLHDLSKVEGLADTFGERLCEQHLLQFSFDATRELIRSLKDRFVGPPRPKQ